MFGLVSFDSCIHLRSHQPKQHRKHFFFTKSLTLPLSNKNPIIPSTSWPLSSAKASRAPSRPASCVQGQVGEQSSLWGRGQHSVGTGAGLSVTSLEERGVGCRGPGGVS